MSTWGMARAKAQFSEVVHRAEKAGPQTISRSGREVAVVVSVDEWKRLQQKRATPAPGVGTLYDILMNSPLRGSGLEIPRLRGRIRKVDF